MTVRAAVSRDGPRIALALRERGGSTATTLDMHWRQAATVAAMLAAAVDADDYEAECQLRADLTTSSP